MIVFCPGSCAIAYGSFVPDADYGSTIKLGSPTLSSSPTYRVSQLLSVIFQLMRVVYSNGGRSRISIENQTYELKNMCY